MIEAEGNMSLKAVVGQRELNILPHYFYSLSRSSNLFFVLLHEGLMQDVIREVKTANEWKVSTQ